MNNIWATLNTVKSQFESMLYATGSVIYDPSFQEFNYDGWSNRVWKSCLYRKAHIAVIDAMDSKGIWLMHCCVFPRTTNPAPIYGFDVFASKTKIAGCFIDFSPTSDCNHQMLRWFSDQVQKLSWSNVRSIPEWGLPIFSSGIVTAANIRDPAEAQQIVDFAPASLKYYLDHINLTKGQVEDSGEYQNLYSRQQKMNPNITKMIEALGFSREVADCFIDQCLFPEL